MGLGRRGGKQGHQGAGTQQTAHSSKSTDEPIAPCAAGFAPAGLQRRRKCGVNCTSRDSNRLLLAAQPKLVTPVLQVMHRVITRFLLKQAGAKAGEADSGAVMLIRRFGSAANLNIHLHCLIVIGLILALNPNARRFWRGLGLGMLLQGALMLPADLLAEDRAAVYVRQLEAMP